MSAQAGHVGDPVLADLDPLEKVPIAMFWLGTVSQKKYDAYIDHNEALPGLHNPEFYPDFIPTYKTGVRAMAKAAIDLFNQ